MILIADAGASKTDWRLVNGEAISQYKSDGFNPRTHTVASFVNSIPKELIGHRSDITSLFYYGAGLTDPAVMRRLSGFLSAEFNRATVTVDSDLMGAARSLFGRESGVACILGTGSAACFYDGKSITRRIPSLGYALGDEGSGAYIGKGILNLYLRNRLPESIHQKFISEFGQLPESVVLDHVYQESKPNAYLSRFSSFVINNVSEPFVYQYAYKCIEDYFVSYFGTFSALQNQKIRFTGSIAYLLSSIIRKFATDHNLFIDLISQHPIAGLALYHKQNGQSTSN